MLIKKGQKIEIIHSRKGFITVKAQKTFDTDDQEFWPVIACYDVAGMTNNWNAGEKIPCRQSLITSWKLI